MYQYQQAQKSQREKERSWCWEQTVKRSVGYLDHDDTAALATCCKQTHKLVREATIEMLLSLTGGRRSVGPTAFPMSVPLHTVAKHMCAVNKGTKNVVKSVEEALSTVSQVAAEIIPQSSGSDTDNSVDITTEADIYTSWTFGVTEMYNLIGQMEEELQGDATELRSSCSAERLSVSRASFAGANSGVLMV